MSDTDINKNETFETLCKHLIKKYNKNITLLRLETTKDFFRMIRDNKSKYLQEILPKKMVIGKFYLIQYNYNGNRIWCPIFTIEYRILNNKNLIYAVNLDYLPHLYKAKYFGKLFYLFKDIIEKSQKAIDAKNEFPLNGVNFDKIYKSLKNNGSYEFSITAFDMSKIRKVHLVSYSLIHRFIFLNTKIKNKETMELEKIKESDIDKKMKLEELISLLENLDKQYNIEVQDYYKKLKAIESKYKLFENV